MRSISFATFFPTEKVVQIDDAHIGYTEHMTTPSELQPDAVYEVVELQRKVMAMYNTPNLISDVQREILAYRMGIGTGVSLTHARIAGLLQKPRTWVRYHEKRGLTRLKKAILKGYK